MNLPDIKLDAAIAMDVMGWERGSISTAHEHNPGLDVWKVGDGQAFAVKSYVSNWHPSSDVAQALRVVDGLVEQGYEITMRVAPDEESCVILDSGGTEPHTVATYGETLPLAICRTALKAMKAT